MSEAKTQATGRSPLSGCAILITALCVVVFLVVFSTWTLFRQFDEIAKFTKETRKPVAQVPLEGMETGINALSEKVEVFRQALADDAAAELKLTPEEINLAIAMWRPFEELRGAFHVESADEGVLRIAISFPLNGKPRMARDGEDGWMVADPRYLEAVMVAEPAVTQREVVLRIKDLIVPGAEVPSEFIEQMSPYRITERYLADPVIGPAMAKLTKVEVKDGALWLVRVPGQAVEGAIDDEAVDSSRDRLLAFLGIAASLFLVVAGLIVFLGLRARSRNESVRP